MSVNSERLLGKQKAQRSHTHTHTKGRPIGEIFPLRVLQLRFSDHYNCCLYIQTAFVKLMVAIATNKDTYLIDYSDWQLELAVVICLPLYYYFF